LWQRARAPLLVLVILVAIWETVYRLHVFPSIAFAGPLDVARALLRLARDGELLTALKYTLTRLGFSFLLSMAIGGLLASLMILLAPFRRGVEPLMLGLQSLPGLVWVPLAILWFGYSDNALYFVTVIGSVFAVTMGFVDAFSAVPPLYAKAARNMGVRGVGLLLRVTVPAATPQLVSAAKVGWSFSWRSLVGAEIIIPSLGGLGFLLDQGRTNLNESQVFAIMVNVLVIGIVIDRLLFASLERSVRRRWGLTGRR
jgi:NitT/TauT family transport system permease protein